MFHREWQGLLQRELALDGEGIQVKAGVLGWGVRALHEAADVYRRCLHHCARYVNGTGGARG